MEFYIDLAKGLRTLHKERLVRRPVQVKGKNGRIYTRMQWVDPSTGEPVHESRHGHIEHETEHKTHSTNPNDKVDVNAPTPKSSRDRAIDDAVRKMSKEEKYDYLKRHEVEWKRNEHPDIDHKNAVMALKEHIRKNPHLAGVEHITNDDAPDPQSKIHPMKNIVDKWYERFSAKEIDDMLKFFKDNHGLAWRPSEHPQIDRMRAASSLKKMLIEKPELMQGWEPEQKVEQSKSNKPQNHPIHDVLSNMSQEDKWAEVKKHGIQWKQNENEDINRMHAFTALGEFYRRNYDKLPVPLTDAQKTLASHLDAERASKDNISKFVTMMSGELKDKLVKKYRDQLNIDEGKGIKAIREATALKEFFSNNPHLVDVHKADLENEQLRNMKIGNKQVEDILRRVFGMRRIGDVRKSKDNENEWLFGEADSFASIQEDDDGTPIFSVVDVGQDGTEWNERVKPLSEIRDFLGKLPGVKGEAKEARQSTKYGKSDIEALLSHKMKLENVTDVRRSADNLWRYKASVDGKVEDGEVEVTDRNVRVSGAGFGLYSNDDVKDFLKLHNTPLHERSMAQISQTLSGEDFEKHFQGKVKARVLEGLRNVLHDMNNSSITTDGNTTLKNGDRLINNHWSDGLSIDALRKVGKHMGFMDEHGNIDTDSHALNSLMYGNKVEASKTKNATEYLQTSFGRHNPWVLNESAKHWTHAERFDAKKDLIGTTSHLTGFAHTPQQKQHLEGKLGEHLHTALKHIPFDLFTHAFVTHGLQFNSSPHDNGMAYNIPSDYQERPYINIFPQYVNSIGDNSLATSDHPNQVFFKTPILDSNGLPTGEHKIYGHSLMAAVLHEFGHVVDHIFSGGSNAISYGRGLQNSMHLMSWGRNKFLPPGSGSSVINGRYTNTVQEAYRQAINDSGKGNVIWDSRNKTWLHEDNFQTPYEGRIYGNPTVGEIATLPGQPNQYRDMDWVGSTHPVNAKLGAEFWANSVSRHFLAVDSYAQYRKNKVTYTDDKGKERTKYGNLTFNQWVKKHFNEAEEDMEQGKIPNDDGEWARKNPEQYHAWQYGRMLMHTPGVVDTLNKVFNRGDFIDKPKESSHLERMHPRKPYQYTKKSEQHIVYL